MFYIEIMSLCIVLLIIILYKVINNLNRIECYRYYTKSLVYSTLICVLNIINYLIEGKDLGYLNIFHYFSHSLTIISTCAVYFNLFLYSEEINSSILVDKKYKRYILSIPFLFLIFLSFNSCFFNSIFYIDDKFNYQRGNLYFIFTIIPTFYFIFTLINAIIRMENPNKLIYKKKNNIIFYFCLLVLILTSIIVVVFGTSHMVIGITIGFVYIYLSFLEQLITIDPLTQLNNKSQLINKLTNDIKNYDESNDLYLLMMDMDDFKSINDKYGHIEGDNAIIEVSNILKQTTAPKNYFVSRFGGDEFNIIVKTDNEKEVKMLCRNIQNKLDEFNKNSNKKYKLKMSIGYYKYNKTIKNVSNFINKADNELYKLKRKKDDIVEK